jgi:hypothetical protein
MIVPVYDFKQTQPFITGKCTGVHSELISMLPFYRHQ